MIRIDIDRMHIVWEPGEEAEAMALLAMSGFVVANGENYRCAEGWERRIHYWNGKARPGGARKGAGRPRRDAV